MSILREYRCLQHQIEFESSDDVPACPRGCTSKSVIVQEFRTPFSIGSERTSTIDTMAKKLAADYGLTDMRNDRDASVMSQTRKESGGRRVIGSGRVQREYTAEKETRWAPQLFNPAPGWSKTGETPSFNFGSSGIKGQMTPTAPILKSQPNLRAHTVFQKPK